MKVSAVGALAGEALSEKRFMQFAERRNEHFEFRKGRRAETS